MCRSKVQAAVAVFTLIMQCIPQLAGAVINNYSWGSGVTPTKIRWGCAACFPKPLHYFSPKSTIFPTLFMVIYDPTKI